MDGHARWLRAQGARVHAISPLPVDELIAYCEARGLDPEESRAAFARRAVTDRLRHAVAARAQSAVLVRLEPQVQEVLRIGAGRGNASRRG